MSNCKLDECLRGKNGSYIRPLIWYAGESIESLVNEIHAVKSAGIDEFILENRGGDWFGTDFWWKLMQTALDTAESLNMRMWILDDSHVNTGSANDSLKKEENAKFRAVNLRVEAVDFAGPVMAGALLLPNRTAGEEIIRVSAYRRDENSGHCIGEAVDLTDRIYDGLCAADFGEGIWRVYFVLTAAPARQGLFADYITMVSKESCRHLIDEVHEKIYQHFAPYFGNVFAGFFSDEPAFGNCDGQYGYDSCDHHMGQLRRIYPWWNDFPEKIAAEADMSVEEVMLNLPALWDNVDEKSPVLRVAYMNVITKAWQENFSCQIGKWCEDHNVEYIGHNLEDRGAHMHTGWGCGHYFRSMAGQHMAGLDIVLNQHVPGIRSINHAANTSNKEYNSDFYNYTLPKLGPSLAHVMPHMKNRSNCEVFGAYGWTCGLVMMRAIFNLFMANGVNNFMPHAFSMNLPGNCRTDNDGIVPPGFCLSKLPPTFYMGGMNPQYRIFGKLMRYVQRICHLLSDGTHIADAAVYYNAEADWINGKFRNIDDVAMVHGWQASVGILTYALLGLIFGINYSGKPFELGYHGLGELVIGVMFGPLNMLGVQAALTGNIFSWPMLCISIGIGCMVTNIVYVHSVMEVNADAELNKMTFARLLMGKDINNHGKQRMVLFIGIFAVIPFVMLITGILLGWWSPWYLLTLCTLPMSIFLIHSTRLFAYGLPRIDTPRWWMGPMGDWAAYVQSGMDWFLFRWLLARNICTFFCLILIIVHIALLITT